MKIQHQPTPKLAQMGASYNARRISDHDLQALRRSLREFGTVEPIVVNRRTGRIVGGHQRVKAAEAEGIEKLPVVHVDLDEAQERQLNLALNRIHGEFDPEALSGVLAELKQLGADLELTGFSDEELTDLLGLVEEPKDGLTDPDSVPEEVTPRTQLGDLWLLDGGHRIFCGDATSANAVQTVMGEDRAVCLWTDPPYGVSYVGKTKKALQIQNDGAEGLQDLLAAAFERAKDALAPGAALYVSHPAGALGVVFGQCFVKAGWRLHQTLVWIKDSLVLGHSDYHYRHEPILFGYHPGGRRRGRGAEGWYGTNSEDSVFEIPRPKASPDHPTCKPVALVTQHPKNSSEMGDVILDPFLGSGTTLIAAERLGRRCYGLELEPKYCDVAVSRWEQFTGKRAEQHKGVS